MLNTGDNVPLITSGDPESLLLKLINGQEGKDPKTGKVIRQMPPAKLLGPQYIDMLTRWVMAGMPQTAEQAAALFVSPTPSGGTPAVLPVPVTPEGTSPGTGTATPTPR
jgi:hypothetical protein